MNSERVKVLDYKIADNKRLQGSLHHKNLELNEAEVELKIEQEAMEEMNVSISKSQAEPKISQLRIQIQNKEAICQTLRDEMQMLSLQANSRARLELKKTDEARKNETINRLCYNIIIIGQK
jgi:hypothetical protein